MSTVSPTTPSTSPQTTPFQERLVLFLMPYFRAVTTDLALARQESLETLAAYGARTRSEWIAAARIIAFSFSALDMLAEAKATEMSASMRLRYRTCANGLNRACQQNEKILAKTLACDQPGAPQAPPEPASAPTAQDLPDTQVEAALQQTAATIQSYRNRLSPHPNQKPWSSPMLAALAAELATT